MVVQNRIWSPANSSAEDYNEDGFQSIEQFNVCLDRNRQASGEKVPVPWPFGSRPVSAEGYSVVGRIEDMRKVLEDNNITYLGFELRFSRRKGLLVDATETLIIKSSDDQSKSVGFSPWWHAANTIQCLLDRQANEAKYTGNIQVEIRNPALMIQNFSTVVRPEAEGYSQLVNMREDVCKEVRQTCLGIVAISFVMRGSRRGKKYPTVLVGVKPGTISSWLYSYTHVTAVIERYSPNGVDLEFLPEIVQPATLVECSLVEPFMYVEMPS